MNNIISRPAWLEDSRFREQIFVDRDYHVHLGGAIPVALIRQWIDSGALSENDTIMDFHTHESFHGRLDKITVGEALDKYRDGMGMLEAYQKPYHSLEDFLTLYRAYSRHQLVYDHAREIANSIYPKADIRMSVPFPPTGEPESWVKETLRKARYFSDSFGVGQQLILLFPRNHFTSNKNTQYWQVLIQALKTQRAGDSDYIKPAFDFAAVPIETSEMIDMLTYIRHEIPESFIAYHHGETCLLPLEVEVNGAAALLPYIDRMGHGMCLGLAMQKCSNEDLYKTAQHVLAEMGERNIGIEVSPSGNKMINNAGSGRGIDYYWIFLESGINLYLGTDDPSFTQSDLSNEAVLLFDVLSPV